MTWAMSRRPGMKTLIRSKSGKVHIAKSWSAYFGTMGACSIAIVKDDSDWWHVSPQEMKDQVTCLRCKRTEDFRKFVP